MKLKMNSATEQFIESESKAESLSSLKEDHKITDIPAKLNDGFQRNNTTETTKTEELVNSNTPDSENNEFSDTEADTNKNKNDDENESKASGDTCVEKEQVDEWQDLLGSGSIMKKILIQGKPESRPQRLERCTINYECSLENGDFVEKQENLEVLLGDHEVSKYIIQEFGSDLFSIDDSVFFL